MFKGRKSLKALSELERLLMDFLWAHEPATAEQIRGALAPSRPMKDSTVRTVLRRLEEKGYVRHRTEGRTYVYRALVEPQNVAVHAVRQIVDRFCGGSVERLLVGMVDNEVLDRNQLQRLAKKIARRSGRKGG